MNMEKKTAKQTLKFLLGEDCYNDEEEDFLYAIECAMEEYAQQQAKDHAIRFEKWCEKNEWALDNMKQHTHTTEELYNEFLKQEEK